MSFLTSPVGQESLDRALRRAIDSSGGGPSAKWDAVSKLASVKFGASKSEAFVPPLVRMGPVSLQAVGSLSSVDALTLAGTVNNTTDVVTAFQNIVRRPDIFIDQIVGIIERFSAVTNQFASNSQALPDMESVLDSFTEIQQAYMLADWLVGNSDLGSYDSKISLSRGLASLRQQLAQGIPALSKFFRTVCLQTKSGPMTNFSNLNVLGIDTSRFASSGIQNIVVSSLVGSAPWADINETPARTRLYDRLQDDLAGYLRCLLDPPAMAYTQDSGLAPFGEIVVGVDPSQVVECYAGTKDWITPAAFPPKAVVTYALTANPGVGTTTTLNNYQLTNYNALYVTATNGTMANYLCQDASHMGSARLITDPRAILDLQSTAAPTNYQSLEDEFKFVLEIKPTDVSYPDFGPTPTAFVVPVRADAGKGICTSWTVTGPPVPMQLSQVPSAPTVSGCSTNFEWQFTGTLAHTEAYYVGYIVILSLHSDIDRFYNDMFLSFSRSVTIRQNPMVMRPTNVLTLTDQGFVAADGIKPTYALVAAIPPSVMMPCSVKGVPTLMAYLQQVTNAYPRGLELLTVFLMDYMNEPVVAPVTLVTLSQAMLRMSDSRVTAYYDLIVAAKGLVVRSPEFSRFTGVRY